MAIWVLAALALALGALLPVQVGANAELAGWLGAAVRASLVNFGLGFFLLTGFALVFVRGLPGAGGIAGAPWWAWTGGVVGASYVLGSTLLGPRLGAVTFFAVLLAGQTVASLIVDHYGWLGFAEREITAGRLAGVALLAAGVVLVRAF